MRSSQSIQTSRWSARLLMGVFDEHLVQKSRPNFLMFTVTPGVATAQFPERHPGIATMLLPPLTKCT